MKIRMSNQQKSFVSLVVLLFVLTFPYQNCGGNFEGAGTASSTSESVTGLSPGPTPTPTPMPGLTPDQKNRAACAANFNAPSFSSMSSTSVTIASGLSTVSGDTPRANLSSLTVQGAKSIINSGVEAASNCDTYTTFTARCNVIVDATHPANFTQAIALDGSSMLGMNSDDAGKTALARAAVDLQNCNQANLTSGQGSFQVRLNRNNQQSFARCVAGSFYVRVNLRSTVDVEQKESAPQFFKVTLANNCWDESRLKMNTEFPRISGVGAAAAIDGNWAVALADNQTMGSLGGVGALHIFNFDGIKWNYHSSIQPADAQNGDSMTAVALKGSTMIVTSAFRGGQGAALVYKLSGNSWNQSQIINPSNAQVGQMFGKSVSYDGTTLVIGAPNYSRNAGDKAGLVYVYTAPGGSFSLSQTLQVPDATFDNKGFGMSVSVSGNLIAVGAPQALTKEGLGKGDVRIFQNSGGWSQVAVKTPGTEVSDNMALKYGASVALSGTKLVIGVPGHDGGNGNTNSGAAVYFANYTAATPSNTWKANELNGVFGTAVAIGSTGVFVGGPKLDTLQGYAEFYDFANLAASKYRIISYNRSANDQLGFSLAVSGNNVMIGARVKDDTQVDSGAAYIYSMK